eukprot:Skav234001  [mRNA]  locus=scaffold2637:31687:33162:- [translate_table: standard]
MSDLAPNEVPVPNDILAIVSQHWEVDKLVEQDLLIRFFERIGVKPSTLQKLDSVLRQIAKDGQLSFKDLFEVLDLKMAPSIMNCPGLYFRKKPAVYEPAQYKLLKSTGEVITFLVDLNIGAGNLRFMCTDASKEAQLSGRVSDDFEFLDPMEEVELAIFGSTAMSLLGDERFRQLTKPRDFSLYLVGSYWRFVTTGYAWEPDGDTFENKETVCIREDGMAEVTVEGFCSSYREGFNTKSTGMVCQYSSAVKSVRRVRNWELVLRGGPKAQFQVKPPPLNLVTLENGVSFNLSYFTGTPSILLGQKISYHGKISEQEGCECIVSFPGKYADGWRECAEGSLHDMSVACVFLTSEADGLGQHVDNPEVGGKCLCHTLYGEREYHRFGYSSQAEYEANDRRTSWGCLWFQRWRENVEVAVSRKQRLVAYFFEDQVGEGLVSWNDLSNKDVNLWNGVGIGGSQKGELAFLTKEHIPFEQRDVRHFLNAYVKPKQR